MSFEPNLRAHRNDQNTRTGADRYIANAQDTSLISASDPTATTPTTAQAERQSLDGVGYTPHPSTTARRSSMANSEPGTEVHTTADRSRQGSTGAEVKEQCMRAAKSAAAGVQRAAQNIEFDMSDLRGHRDLPPT